MGALNDAVRTYNVAKETVSGVSDSMGGQALKRVAGKSRTIASMSKDGLCAYPAIYSQGVLSSNEEIPFDIARYLEIQYAMFTMIAMGMNPVMDGIDPRKHVMSFYSEESENAVEETIEPKTDHISISVRDVSAKDAKELLNSLESSGFYEIYTSNYSRLNESAESTSNDPDIEEEVQKRTNKHIQDVYDGKKETISVKSYKLSKQLLDAHPTMIDINLKMRNGTDIPITLAIKVTPHLITSAESVLIFSRIAEDKPLFNMARLFSGEIKLFKDIILQMERAKEDKELYAKLGRHPWFRQLINRGGKRKVMGFMKSIPFIRHMFKNKNVDILPICSLIVTKDEVVRGMNKTWEYFKKDLDGWNGVMDRLMLLCWAVYDTEENTIEFVFNGLSKSEIIRADQLSKKVKNGVGMENEIIRNLSRRI